MLKLLLRLWILQQRRNFSWKDVFVGVYLIFLYVCMAIGYYMGAREGGEDLLAEGVPATIGAGIVVGMLIPDIILKIVMKKDATAMDDYIKARPVTERIWNTFLMTRNLLSVWNLILPVLCLPMLLWILPSVGQATSVFLLLLVYSEMNGLCITCYRKTTKWKYRWPILIGWLIMFFMLLTYQLVYSSLWSVAWLLGGLYIGAVFFSALIVVYLNYLKIYDEVQHKANKTLSLGKISLFSIQYIGLARAKRIRNMVLLIAGVFIFDAYLMIAVADDVDSTTAGSVIIYALGIIMLPSVVLSQWTLGIEGNYFDGLMSKPITIQQLLCNNFYYYIIISMVSALFTLPIPFLTPAFNFSHIMAGICLSIFLSLYNMPTCLFSSRLEIFSASMFNWQGANTKINLYAIAFLIPLGLLTLLYIYVGELAFVSTCIALGIVSLAVHKWAIAKIANMFYVRRYKRMEEFNKK